MGIYFDDRGEVRDSAVLLADSAKAFNIFVDEPTNKNLAKFDSALQVLRVRKIPFDYTDYVDTLIYSAKKEEDTYKRDTMIEYICNMNLMNKENPFSYSHSSASLVTNSDFKRIKKMYEGWQSGSEEFTFSLSAFRIKKIIVNNQTTIVMWYDGTKTIVRPTANDKFDLDAAVCAAIAKKLYGTNSALKRDIQKKVVYQENKKKEGGKNAE